jgi:hypothetical protein
MGVYASRIQGKEQPTNLACQYQFITSIPSRLSGFSFFFFLFTSSLEPSSLPLGLRVFSLQTLLLFKGSYFHAAN